jgi:hypothetical protein
MKNTQRFTTGQLVAMKEAAARYRDIATAASDALSSLLSPADEETYLSIMADVSDSRRTIQAALRKLPLLSEAA